MAPLILVLLLAQSAHELYREGLLLLRSNDAARAADMFDRALKLDPADPLVWMAVADARLRLGRTEEALRAEAEATRIAAADPIVRKARSMFHARFAEGSKEAPVAAKHWKQAIELDPERPAYVTRYLQLLLNARAEREAEVESERAVRRFPKHAELHRLRALALYSQGRTQDAIDSFLCAIDLEPGNEAHYASLETLLSDAGARISEIVQRLDALAAADTQSPLPLYLKALCLPEQAPTLLRRAIELEASFWPAYFELQKLAPNPQERIRLLEKVVALHPTYAPAYYALAQTHAIIGNREAARQAREQHHRFSK